MDLNSYIWLLAPKCRKALVVLTKYAVYFLCLILLCDSYQHFITVMYIWVKMVTTISILPLLSF